MLLTTGSGKFQCSYSPVRIASLSVIGQREYEEKIIYMAHDNPYAISVQTLSFKKALNCGFVTTKTTSERNEDILDYKRRHKSIMSRDNFILRICFSNLYNTEVKLRGKVKNKSFEAKRGFYEDDSGQIQVLHLPVLFLLRARLISVKGTQESCKKLC